MSDGGPGRTGIDISVVVPTFNRETRLAFLLEALADQTLDKRRFEVLVVRARNSRGPFISPPDGLPFRFLTYEGKGRPAAQRNHGWRAASAPVVAFTDDDCRPARDWLECLLEASGGERVVQGQTKPDPDEQHLLWGYARSVDVPHASQWYETCNMAYPREVLEQLGGFDERFPHPWGEDTDLGLRAVKAGETVHFAEGALVWHCVHPRPLTVVFREARNRNKVELLAWHPIGRDGLYLRFFAYRSHPRALLAAVGLAHARRTRGLSLAAVVPYLAMGELSRSPSSRALARALVSFPSRFLIDLHEIAVTAWIGLRDRFPAL